MKYIIEETKGFGSVGGAVRTFVVRTPGQPRHEGTAVWLSSGRASCTKCQGPLQAMMQSCPHARAVKRRYGDRNE